MKIQKIQFYNQTKTTQPNIFKNVKQENNIDIQTLPNAYVDYNINFRGRTPENFYSQEFNIKNMPQTMKEFLNSDYEKNKHIPPEQIMSESFKYLNISNNFSDVKTIYTDETLFNNLHEPNDKIRTGLINEIKQAKDIENIPLFKDETDNLGIYLLKKIYLEGKTIKEINKDFYEKDINPNYKGILTEPITQKVTSAYGIQYPKLDFWNSFIATRDEYKKFFIELPKKSKEELEQELKQNIATRKSNITPTNTPNTKNRSIIERKFRIKDFQKEHIKKEIKNRSKGNTELIQKTIRKQFKQDDPEANFIIKYFSPIMTIAADKIHLSEEERDFANLEKSKGKKIENLFYDFWKNKPELLEHYSIAITDTIDLFEERYGNGGNIPINKDFERITDKTENKKAIDYVSNDFLKLLNHVQTIVPNRIEAKEIHDNLQKEWEEHFQWRYGELKNSTNSEPQVRKDFSNMLEDAALQNNAEIYNLKTKDGENAQVVCNLDECFKNYVTLLNPGLPTKFINFITNKCLQDPKLTKDLKLISSVYTDERLDIIDTSELADINQVKSIITNTTQKYFQHHSAATIASLERLAIKSDKPISIYRFLIGRTSPSDDEEMSKIMKFLDNEDEREINIKNQLYEKYLAPLTNKEAREIANIIVNFIKNYNLNSLYNSSSVAYNRDDLIKMIGNLKHEMEKDSSFAKRIKTIIQTCDIPKYARTLLDTDLSSIHGKAKQETVIMLLLQRF